MAVFKLSNTERRRLSLFVVCFGIAMLSWLFFSLSETYTYRTQTHLRYLNTPPSIAFNPLQSDTVELEIEGTGWQLLFSKLNFQIPFVNIDVSKLKRDRIALSSQPDSINKYLGPGKRLISIRPDTLYFDFSQRNYKKVPITLTNQLQFKKQYGISGPIRFSPDSVTLTGPESLLQKIGSWHTDSLKINAVETDIRTIIALKPSFSSKLTVFPNVIRVVIPVDEFTEKTIELPIKIINNKLHDVKLVPEKVRVKFMVGLNQFAKVDKGTVNAVVDLNGWIEKGDAQLPVQLIGFPNSCKLISLEPQVVDFIVNK